MLWQRPLLECPTATESWHEMDHVVECEFAFLDPTPKALQEDVEWAGARYSGAPTSKAAADDLGGGGGPIAYTIMVNYVIGLGTVGATADQAQAALGAIYPMMRKHQTASARVSEALDYGRFAPTGQSRKTRSRRWAQVLVDARLRPRWRCAAGCTANYLGLWRIRDGVEVPCWDPRPLRLPLNSAQHAALSRAAGDVRLADYVMQHLGLADIPAPAWEPSAGSPLSPPVPAQPSGAKGLDAFLQRLREK